MLSKYRRWKQKRQPTDHRDSWPSPADGSRRLVVGFAFIILCGAILLRLPISTQGESVSFVDALFTSTSAVTVTGLTVSSTAETYSRFGQLVILLLLQVGGIGFVSLSAILFRIAGRQIIFHQRVMLQQELGVEESVGVFRTTINVLLVVVAIEFAGALLLFMRWVGELPWQDAAYLAIFHSISAFCNAGFDLFAGTELPVMFGYGSDLWTLTVLGMLILIGGLGVVVIDDILTIRRSRLTLHTRITLRMTLLLTILGCIMMFADEAFSGTLFRTMGVEDRLTTGIFTVVSARTAGITILPLEQLSQASQLILILWMFIGGAPSSMAGGVSMNTVAVLGTAMGATVRGQSQAVVLGRAVPTETIMKAMAVMTVSTLVVVIATLGLVVIDRGSISLFNLGFEVVSAFSNTGYSLGVTPNLTTAGRLLIAFVMFWGRLGPLTLVVVLAQRQRQSSIQYPEEKIILG